MLTVIIGLLIFLLVIQNVITDELDTVILERDFTIEENKVLIDGLNKTVSDKDLIIKNKNLEIQKAIDNAEIMIALSPLRDLISDDEIEELIKIIPRGNTYRNAFQVTAGFGESIGYHGKPRRNHTGFDSIPVAPETADWTITPLSDGVVKNFGVDSVYGKYVTIRHSDRVETFYAHLDKIYYSGTTGKIVDSDSKIGVMGGTGLVSSDVNNGGGKHLHMELRVWVSDRWVSIDPLPFMKRY